MDRRLDLADRRGTDLDRRAPELDRRGAAELDRRPRLKEDLLDSRSSRSDDRYRLVLTQRSKLT